MKNKKKIFTITIIIFSIIVILISIRFYKLFKIQKENEQNESKKNCYYYSVTPTDITEYWRKDGIMKMSFRQINENNNIIFWENTNTKEEFIFWNGDKKIYSNGNGGLLKRIPNGITLTDGIVSKLIMAINPTLQINTIKYNEKECYYLKISNQEEIIEKNSGLVLYSNYNGAERTIKYEFDSVTDNEISKPDINEYEFKK